MRGWCEMKKHILFGILILLLCMPSLSFGEVVSYELFVGESLGLSAKLFEDDGTPLDDDISWTSSDSSIASVSDGIITAKKRGIATISYKSKTGTSLHTGSVYITVKSTVKDVELNLPKDTLFVGETMLAGYEILPMSGLTGPIFDEVKFSSNDKDIFTVDSDGIVTAISDGSAYLRITTTDGNQFDLEKIYVKGMVTHVDINETDLKIKVGEKLQLSANVYPDTSIEKSIEWSSSHHIDIDDNGLLVGEQAGIGYITASSVDGKKKDSVKIIVESMVKDITLNTNKYTLNDDQLEYQLEAQLIPLKPGQDPLVDDITWNSNKTSVATVSSTGLVKAIKNGIVTITATSKDGKKTASAVIDVNITDKYVIEPTGIQVLDHLKNVRVGESVDIPFKLMPLNATENNVTAKLYGGDGDVESNDGYYTFTAYDEGRYTVMFTGENEIKTTTTFEVKSNLAGVEIIPDPLVQNPKNKRYIVYLGQSEALDHTLIKASDSSFISVDDVTWSSTDSSVITVNSNGVFTAKALGQASIRIETKDNNNLDFIPIEVVSMVNGIDLPSKVEVKTGERYDSYVNYIPKDNLLYGYTDVLHSVAYVYTKSIKVPTALLENEVKFEDKRQSEIKALLEKKYGDQSELQETLVSSQERERLLNSFIKKAKDGYIEVHDSTQTLTDRNFDKWVIAEFNDDNDYYISEYNAIMEVENKTFDLEHSDTMFIHFSGDVTELKLYDDSGKLIQMSEKIDSEALENQQKLSDEKEQLLAEKERKEKSDILRSEYTASGLSLDQQPKDNTILAVDEAKKYELIQPSFEDNYQRSITRLELTTLCIEIYDNIMNQPPKNYPYNVFLDTSDSNAIRAFQYGIVSVSGDRLFKPNQAVNRYEMADMLYKTLLAIDKSIDEDRSPVKEDVFVDDVLIPEIHKRSIQHLAYDHTVIKDLSMNIFAGNLEASIDDTLLYAVDFINAINR